MKTIIICPRTPRKNFGGLENYTMRMAAKLIMENDEVAVFTTSTEPGSYNHNGVTIREFPVFAPNESYYFSRISQSWGWATWKRAWLLQDKDMKRWPEAKSSNLLGKIFHDKAIVAYWEDLLQKFYDKKRINWDGQWTFACFVNNGLCIMPKVNLISNIGFGDGATHTRQHNHKFSNLPVSAIKFPLTHPDKKMVNHQAEDYTMKWFFGVNESWKQRVKWYIKSLFPVPYNFLKRIYHKNQ